MKNYFNFKKINNDYLITNDFGEYAFLNAKDFRSLIEENEFESEETKKQLEESLFIYDGSIEEFVEKARGRMGRSKSYLYQATQLHIFVVTTACNLNCIYCQAQKGDDVPHGMMDKETAKKAVDIALSSPVSTLDFEFQGGEPLMNFDIIKYIVEYSQEVNEGRKSIGYSIVSNLSLLTDEMIDFIKEHNISISTSLDGDEELHVKNRPMRSGDNSYKIAVEKIRKLRENGIMVGAINTTTKHSLAKGKEMVDAYLDNGFNNIQLRPLTPLGTANDNWNDIGYTPKEFVGFFRETFDYIYELNKNGTQIIEGLSRILLTKILYKKGVNYMELRSPCGAGFGQIAYYYDGNIYTCDEGRMLAEMGDESFKMGTVDDSYEKLIESPVCKVACKSSILECMNSCSECVYQPYCGICPVINYADRGDVFEKAPNNYKCQINKGILDCIFEKIYKDEDAIEIFKGWI